MKLIILGLFIIFIGIIWIYKNKKKKINCNYDVTSTVCEIIKDKDENNKNTYSPVISYKYKNQEYKKPFGYITKSKNMYHVGDKINIKINENKPEEFINPKANVSLIGVMFLGIGVLFILLGI